MADLHDLSIPQHRIKYFKHAPTGTVLWDKDARIDLLFGSAPPFERIKIDDLQKIRVTNNPNPSRLKLNPEHTPLQRFLNKQHISDFNSIKRLLMGPGFGCKVKKTKNLYLVMYHDQSCFISQAALSQRTSSSDCLDHLRGVIYEVGSNKLVCMAFDKFWESFDFRSAAPVIDWNSVEVREKCDGSLTKLYNYNGSWIIASNGCINADAAKIPESNPPTTVGKLFRHTAAQIFPGG